MKKILLSALFLCAAGATATAAPIPDDGIDDRADLQAELDANYSVTLPCGVFDIGINPGSGQAGIASINLSGSMALRGSGPCTVLHFTGTTSGDWRGVREYGAANLLAELTIDTSDLVTGDEQSHAVEVVGNSTFGPADGNVVRDLWINHPFTGTIKGDCLRLLGEDSYRVTRTIVQGVQFTACKRSAVAVQRGVYDWQILDSTFVQSTDQMIDGEQSGSAHNGRGVIANSVFFATSGKFAAAMSGTETADLIMEGNTFVGQGISCRSCNRLVFDGNIVFHDAPGSADATIVLVNSTDALVTGNVIIRDAGDAGPVLSITNQNADQPRRTSIIGNTIVQNTGDVGINVLSAYGLRVQDNGIYLATVSTAPHAIKLSRSSTQVPMNDAVTITGNQLAGPWAIGVTLQSTLTATLGFNTLAGSPGAKGLSCNASTTGPVVSAGNNWSASSCSIATAGNP